MAGTTYTQAMLVEAEAAYHALLTGTAVVEVVDQNGEKVRFTPANRYALQNYIGTMRAELCQQAGFGVNPNSPMGFFF